jgi:putative permease
VNQTRKNIFFLSLILFLSAIIVFLNVVAVPLILSVVVSFLLSPAVNFLESKGIRRSYSSFTIIVLIITTLFIFLWIFLPIFYYQVTAIIKRLPDFKTYLETVLFPKMQHIAADITGQPYKKTLHLSDIVSIDLQNFETKILSRIGSSTRFLLEWLIVLIMTPIFMFFALRDSRKIYEYIYNLTPQDIRPTVFEFCNEVNKKLKDVIFGQILVIISLCCLYSTAFFIAGLPYAIAVGVIVGCARFIPYFDVVTGISLGFFVLVTNGANNQQILYACIAFLSVQCLDGLFITPKIMGKFSGLHPFLVILSVLCFGDWFGFYGVLFAIPMATIARVAYKMLLSTYLNSPFFRYTK